MLTRSRESQLYLVVGSQLFEAGHHGFVEPMSKSNFFDARTLIVAHELLSCSTWMSPFSLRAATARWVTVGCALVESCPLENNVASIIEIQSVTFYLENRNRGSKKSQF